MSHDERSGSEPDSRPGCPVAGTLYIGSLGSGKTSEPDIRPGCRSQYAGRWLSNRWGPGRKTKIYKTLPSRPPPLHKQSKQSMREESRFISGTTSTHQAPARCSLQGRVLSAALFRGLRVQSSEFILRPVFKKGRTRFLCIERGGGQTARAGYSWYPPVTPASSAYMISLRWRSGCPIVCPDESATRPFRGDADGRVASAPRV